MSLLSYQGIPGSIPGSSVGFFSSGELFHGMYRMGIFVSMFCPVSSGRPSNCICDKCDP